jgi:hypothetical protein
VGVKSAAGRKSGEGAMMISLVIRVERQAPFFRSPAGSH